jgi:hypothetical protein
LTKRRFYQTLFYQTSLLVLLPNVILPNVLPKGVLHIALVPSVHYTSALLFAEQCQHPSKKSEAETEAAWSVLPEKEE